jgi:MoxR-like ATPase
VSATASDARGTVTDDEFQRAQRLIGRLSAAFRHRVVGQESLQLSLLVALLGDGHVLLESVPGLAKTTAAQTLADAVSGTFSRIQCTPDLLPSDIVGTQVFDPARGTFSTQLGPVHANVVLLDEINRSSAKTQSAMLEAMQERQTSIGGVVHRLPRPFVVFATQNPIEHEGTYELPEAQLDRFLIKEVLTYPSADDEIEILNRLERDIFGAPLDEGHRITAADVLELQRIVGRVYLDDAIKRYIVALVQATRPPSGALGDLGRGVAAGASPRASISFARVSRAVALLHGRTYVTPNDVALMRGQVLRHRIMLNFDAVADGVRPEWVVDAVFRSVPTP